MRIMCSIYLGGESKKKKDKWRI